MRCHSTHGCIVGDVRPDVNTPGDYPTKTPGYHGGHAPRRGCPGCQSEHPSGRRPWPGGPVGAPCVDIPGDNTPRSRTWARAPAFTSPIRECQGVVTDCYKKKILCILPLNTREGPWACHTLSPGTPANGNPGATKSHAAGVPIDARGVPIPSPIYPYVPRETHLPPSHGSPPSPGPGPFRVKHGLGAITL